MNQIRAWCIDYSDSRAKKRQKCESQKGDSLNLANQRKFCPILGKARNLCCLLSAKYFR